MERLTVFDGEFWIHKDFPPVEEDRVDEFIDCVKELAAHLAAYEDTGLSPEEVCRLKREKDSAIENLSRIIKSAYKERDAALGRMSREQVEKVPDGKFKLKEA